MLLEEFDEKSDAVINPEMEVEQIAHFPAVTISCFSHSLFEKVCSDFDVKQIAEVHCAAWVNPIYEVKYKGKRFAMYQSWIGEPACVGEYEQLIAMGSKCLILLGNCGVLDKNIEDCGIIIPTAAIRDEGTSYHYMKSGDMLAVNHLYREEFKEVLRAYGYPYVEGVTWTTDAFYRETRDKVNRRKAQGAVCVDMECAGMQALCDYRGTEFFQFFYAGDNLDHATWELRSLNGDTKIDDKCKIMYLAFELGLKIQNRDKKRK